MARYIDAEIFAKRIKASPAFEKMAFEGELLQRVVLDLLGNTPTADVEEVKHGEWKKVSNTKVYWYICSVCAEEMPRNKYGGWSFSSFCPDCGAKMDGQKERF